MATAQRPAGAAPPCPPRTGAAPMTWLRPIRGALLLLAGVAQAASAQTTADAKADGKAFGGSVIDRAKGAATTAPDASRVPGFNPAATQSLEDLADHPDRIEGAARSAATGNTAIRTTEGRRGQSRV